MNMDFWNNFWTASGVIFSFIISAVAVVISLKSYKQTEKQIELSNKQQLFEKRLRAYLEIEKMSMTYKKFNGQGVLLIPRLHVLQCLLR